ncbi:hypothetical protein G6F37_012051 [Rhizopus arrhizus]|nr:hypothetical protein G6F38_012228 [Rhizopus arrhizus]KAG1145973.1 hypothetical protein G6F37_012051 [Rhizopus arrhizus]
MLLQTKSACWSAHCGIASLNHDITINPVLSALDHRFLLASIAHKNFLFTPFHILTIYAPANPSERRRFYLSLDDFDPLVSFIQTHSSRLIITGDFNYSPLNNLGAPPSCRTLLDQNMLNCMAPPMDMQPTFRRDTSLSTIDYIYSDPQNCPNVS